MKKQKDTSGKFLGKSCETKSEGEWSYDCFKWCISWWLSGLLSLNFKNETDLKIKEDYKEVSRCRYAFQHEWQWYLMHI